MKDIVYANFAQLSYLNWHKLKKLPSNDIKHIFDKEFEEIKTDKYSEWDKGGDYYLELSEEGHKIYDKSDMRIFMLYSEDEKEPSLNPKFPELQDWEFLCGYDHKKIRKEAGKIISDVDSGFQASAFKKGNKVMIAFRGSDAVEVKFWKKKFKENTMTDWVRTNLNLGINNYVEQLTCVAWVYDQVKAMEPSAEIHITGHSLGGALAQFCFVYSGGIHPTVTWNGLGIGRVDKDFKVDTRRGISTGDYKEVLINQGYMSKEEEWLPKCRKAIGQEIYDGYISSIKNKINLEEDFIVEIEFELRMMYEFQESYKKIKSGNYFLNNIYFFEDLTPNLQERIGVVTVVNKEYEGIEHDKEGSGIDRKIKKILTKSGGAYHSIPNFLPYMNDEGVIQQGKLHDIHIINAIKSLVLAHEEIENKVIEELERENEVGIPQEILDVVNFNRKKYEFDGTDRDPAYVIPIKKSYDNFLFEIEEFFSEYDKKWYELEGEKYCLGKFANIFELAGVIYGGVRKIPVDILAVLKKKIDNNQKVVDDVSWKLIEYFYQKGDLKKESILYKNAENIIGKSNLKIHSLLNESLKDKEVEEFSFIRPSLNKVLGEVGYVTKKDKYLKNNSEISCPSEQLAQRVYTNYSSFDHRRVERFLKSFLPDEEAEKKKKDQELQKENDRLVNEAREKRIEKEVKEKEEQLMNGRDNLRKRFRELGLER